MSIKKNLPNRPKTLTNAPKRTQVESRHPLNETKTAFGSEPVLSFGMSKQDYFKLRDYWYDKVQKSGHNELERFNEYNQGLVSSYLHRTIKSSATKQSNYAVSAYYDHLNTFLNHIEYIKASKHLQLKYKINRFFHEIKPRNKASKRLSDSVTYALNIYILKAIVSGASLESISRRLGQVKPIKSESDVAKLAQISISKRILYHTKGTNKNRLWMRMRLIHEVAMQYLVLSGQVDPEELYNLDLLGLDSVYVNKFISEQLGFEVKPKSIASRVSMHVY